MTRYKVIGKDGADLGPNENGYSSSRVREEAEAWMEVSEDPDVLIVPIDGPDRSTDPSAAKYRDSKMNKELRAQFTPEFLARKD